MILIKAQPGGPTAVLLRLLTTFLLSIKPLSASWGTCLASMQ